MLSAQTRPLRLLERPALRRHLHLGPVQQLRDGGYLDLSEIR